MALEGPQIRFTRADDIDADTAHRRALDLARAVEELLERTPSTQSVNAAHSTRMARAMAASLVDELEALVRGARKSGVA